MDQGGGRRSERERTDGWPPAVSYAPGRVIIVHRFAYAVIHDVDALAEARLLGHRATNPPRGAVSAASRPCLKEVLTRRRAKKRSLVPDPDRR